MVKIYQIVPYLMDALIFAYEFVENIGVVILIIELQILY